jgi:hypothetical protein
MDEQTKQRILSEARATIAARSTFEPRTQVDEPTTRSRLQQQRRTEETQPAPKPQYVASDAARAQEWQGWIKRLIDEAIAADRAAVVGGSAEFARKLADARRENEVKLARLGSEIAQARADAAGRLVKALSSLRGGSDSLKRKLDAETELAESYLKGKRVRAELDEIEDILELDTARCPASRN